MQYLNKREKILDAMQQLMTTADTRSITVSEIAQKAGIGKGSIYYYFPSKNDILDGVIERAYSRVLEKGRALAAASDIDAFCKMEIIYHACLEASRELRRQESFNAAPDGQERAFIHLKFAKAIITHLRPILADILRQAVAENGAVCEYPEETALYHPSGINRHSGQPSGTHEGKATRSRVYDRIYPTDAGPRAQYSAGGSAFSDSGGITP